MIEQNIMELDGVSKNYERKIAISSLSFRVKKGELIALIGPSGAGKTTLLNLLAMILQSDSGEILIDSKPISHYSNPKIRARKIGMIRQQFDLVGQLPVVHNVLAGRLAHWSFLKSLLSLFFVQEKDAATAALKRVGLEEKLYERTSNLSGGEQQRVALARMLLQKPEVVLADEPVASLDPARAEDILKMLTSIATEENQTVIASLHSVEYARKYFNRLIALKNGKIQFDLPADQVSDDQLQELYQLKELKQNAIL